MYNNLNWLQQCIRRLERRLSICNETIVSDSNCPPIVHHDLFMQLNGEDFTSDRNLQGISNFGNVTDNLAVVEDSSKAIVIRFELPSFNGVNILDEYVFPSEGNLTLLYSSSTGVDGVWTVQASIDLNGVGDATFNIVANDFIKFVCDNNLGYVLVLYPDSANEGHFVQNDTTFYLLRDTSYVPDWIANYAGAITVEQFAAGAVSQDLKENQAVYNEIFVFDANTVEIHISKVNITVETDDTEIIPLPIYVSTHTNQGYFLQVLGNSQVGATFTKFAGDIIGYNLGANIAAGFTYDLDIMKATVVLQTASLVCNGLDHFVSVTPGFEDYDELVFRRTTL